MDNLSTKAKKCGMKINVKKTKSLAYIMTSTVVCHLDVVVGLYSEDPNDL